MDNKDMKILRLLERDAKLGTRDIATVTELDEEEVSRRIRALEDSGIIRGYKCVVDWERLAADAVSATIQLNVTPKEGLGFEDVARRIAGYPEVESVALMSGSCDLLVTVKDKSFHRLSSFVARELATIESVNSTVTQFIMRRYKDFGILLSDEKSDERSVLSL